MKKSIILFIGIFCFLVNASGQGWQRYYGASGAERGLVHSVLPDGSVRLFGSVSDTANNALSDVLALDLDAWGNPLQSAYIGVDSLTEYANVVLYTDADHFMLAGGVEWPGSGLTPRQIAVFSDQEVRLLPDSMAYPTGGAVVDGGYLVCGARFREEGGVQLPEALLIRLDSLGDYLWSRPYELGDFSEISHVIPFGDKYLLCGYTFLDQSYQAFLLVTDSGGSEMNVLYFKANEAEWGRKLLISEDSTLLLVSETRIDAENSNIMLRAFDPDLTPVWNSEIALPGNQMIHAAFQRGTGPILLAGESQLDADADRDGLLMAVDPEGNLIWSGTPGGLNGDILWSIQPAPKGGGLLLAGQTASFGDGSLQAWLIGTDSLGNYWNSEIKGSVLIDENEDCYPDFGETGLENWLVEASSSEGRYYSITNELGEYSIPVDTGNWYVSVWPPNSYWGLCTDSIWVNIETGQADTSIDFSVQAVYDCPLLEIKIATPFLRRCFPNTYALNWFNYGTETADSARALIVLDPYLSMLDASVPYTVSGDSVWFYLGSVSALSGGALQFSVFVDCDDTVLGQNHCVEAYIYPDSVCTAIGSEWDMSDLVVSGYCEGDSVVLTIRNSGIGNMSQPVEFVITEDIIIFKKESIQLLAGEDTSFVLYPQGATVVLQISQTPGHPGSDQLSLVIEGCGAFPFSTGFAQMFDVNDDDPFTDIECRANIGSYDPNDKSAYPLGLGPDRIIAGGEELEYLIRFQNTGTDTAFRVEIRDTLPEGLLLNSLKPGASSHNYTLRVYETGILQFVFDPIALPDSSTSPEGSSGFVQFRVNTQAGLPSGFQIENSAAIYFDFNPPVITSRVIHQIGNPLDALTSSNGQIGDIAPSLPLQIAPNPFGDYTLLSWPEARSSGMYRIEVYNQLGQLVLAQPARSGTFRLEGRALPAGLYFVVVYDETGKIAEGRVSKL